MSHAGDLTALFQDHRARGALLLAAYDAAGRSRRSQVTLAEYRCRKRCDLLVVWQSPAGRLARLRPYKMSRDLNDTESSADGRAANTSDGDRHWTGVVLFLDEVPADVPLPVNCDHFRSHVIVHALLAELAGRQPGRPFRRVLPL